MGLFVSLGNGPLVSLRPAMGLAKPGEAEVDSASLYFTLCQTVKYKNAGCR